MAAVSSASASAIGTSSASFCGPVGVSLVVPVPSVPIPPVSLGPRPCSGTLSKPEAVPLALITLPESPSFLESKRDRSGVRPDLTEPPKMFSRATDVEAVALVGVRGHESYQLLVLRSWHAC